MKLADFLNKKFLEWQLREGGRRRTLDDFAEYLGVKRPTLSAWMNGSRSPGDEHKKRLVELYGKAVLDALDEDPGLFYINNNWNNLTPKQQQELLEHAEKLALKNDTERTSQQRKTRTVG